MNKAQKNVLMAIGRGFTDISNYWLGTVIGLVKLGMIEIVSHNKEAHAKLTELGACEALVLIVQEG